MSRHFQSTDFNEPYSSVAFQYKQQTSPYPYGQQETIFPKKQQVTRWFRLHCKTVALITFFCLFVLYCLQGTISVFWTFAKIKMDNIMFDRGYVACGLLRKEPMLYIQDTHHIQVVWEMNCGTKNKEMTLSYWYQGQETEKIVISPVEPNVLDTYHTAYKATLGPLTQGGSIQYTIEMTKQNKAKRKLASHSFQWFADAEQQPIRIAAMADNQFGMMTFSKLLRQIRKLPSRPHFLLHAGDAVQNYPSLRQWQTDFAAPLTAHGLIQTMPLIYAHGNHDYDSLGNYVYTRSTDSDNPWFAFSLANGAIRFIVLDSNLDWEAQDQWLQREIDSDEFKQAQFRIVVVHIPPFLEYWDPEAWFQLGQSEWGAFVKDRYVPLFEQGGVDLVISGHQHNYERGERHGVHYAIIGGGGGDLDFDQVKDWGMYEAKLLDFHFIMLEFKPPETSEEPWLLQWDTYDIKGHKVDTALIMSSSKKSDFNDTSRF